MLDDDVGEKGVGLLVNGGELAQSLCKRSTRITGLEKVCGRLCLDNLFQHRALTLDDADRCPQGPSRVSVIHLARGPRRTSSNTRQDKRREEKKKKDEPQGTFFWPSFDQGGWTGDRSVIRARRTRRWGLGRHKKERRRWRSELKVAKELAELVDVWTFDLQDGL